jgi:hypothetical protein
LVKPSLNHITCIACLTAAVLLLTIAAAHLQVHTAHSAVSTLAPTLNSCLTSGLAGLSSISSSNGMPIQIAAACFPGCVQLLANVFMVDLDKIRSTLDGSMTASFAVGDVANAAAIGSSGSDLAATVLSNVCDELLSVGEGAPDVDVAVGAAAATTKIGNNTTAEAAQLATAQALPAALLPSPVAADKASVSNKIALHCCEPACLTAGKPQQQLTLQLQLPALQSQEQQQQQGEEGSFRCRLVAFQDGAVVTDQEVTLLNSSIR